MPRKEPLAEKIFQNLYRDPDDKPVSFSSHELAVKKMYEDAFAKWLTDPDLDDKHIIALLQNEHGRSKTQAWRDVAIIKGVLGNIKNANKEWHRYTVIKMLKEAYEKAKSEGKLKEMVMAADKLGKYTKLDKDDLDEIPWDQIIPPSWEPSADPKLLGINENYSDIEERKAALRKKYLPKSDIDNANIVGDE
jgi:hypothetical protein